MTKKVKFKILFKSMPDSNPDPDLEPDLKLMPKPDPDLKNFFWIHNTVTRCWQECDREVIQ
jgi:hypothetical protein